MADGAGGLSGLGPGKGKKEGARSPLRLLARTQASPARATAKDVRSAAARRQQWRSGGVREMPRENEMGRLGLGFIDGEEAVWEGEPT
uniref:Uncharacterized protein n=1 Tax=Oryza sativa subsp. japonica TaxID=39947 RepID=Q69KJ8_ORYSJ|nr:hypothetical protein [Oryza sativa Japonica Group]BAD36542.1 hypothetical protein [Oryza sativa Japonica Group]